MEHVCVYISWGGVKSVGGGCVQVNAITAALLCSQEAISDDEVTVACRVQCGTLTLNLNIYTKACLRMTTLT